MINWLTVLIIILICTAIILYTYAKIMLADGSKRRKIFTLIAASCVFLAFVAFIIRITFLKSNISGPVISSKVKMNGFVDKVKTFGRSLTSDLNNPGPNCAVPGTAGCPG